MSRRGYVRRGTRSGLDMLYSDGYPGQAQAGSLSFKQIGNAVKKGINWAKKNKPLEKALKFADEYVPDLVKTNPI